MLLVAETGRSQSTQADVLKRIFAPVALQSLFADKLIGRLTSLRLKTKNITPYMA